ncbi:hypothetical protein BACCIP111895_02984 [Neobacillus rhizosphaerae]|uniref:ABC transporter permease n=2 Tax=Neobacillus rhizosphaerae TaxID=2880965 RepID=A0ABM9EUA9_9BACI|nr:hypothetical protein BACCIP111895_02984 [Neobacillus rhizosphaerae]
MSLTKVSLIDIVKKQYVYKLKAYSQVFISLIFIQLLAVFFSLNGVGGGGISSGSIQINVSYFSADFVVAFTMLWGFITAIVITTKTYRIDDFIFVTNRASSNLSNMVFLLIASVIGGITAMLSTNLIKVIVYYFKSDFALKSTTVMDMPMEFLIGIFSTILYVFLFCALGYLVGTLVQISKVFAVLLPAAFLGGLIFDGLSGKTGVIAKVLGFYFTESSLALFIVKIIMTAGLLFIGAFALSNRREVRT